MATAMLLGQGLVLIAALDCGGAPETKLSVFGLRNNQLLHVFQLPPLRAGVYFYITMHVSPSPGHPGTDGPPVPFAVDRGRNTLVFQLSTSAAEDQDAFLLFVPLDKLLSHILPKHKHDTLYFWNEWGPTSTRLLPIQGGKYRERVQAAKVSCYGTHCRAGSSL